MSMNKVILVGCLAEKPVVREDEAGQKMVGLSVVTRRYWHDAETGEERAGQEWHRVVIFDQHLADFAEATLGPDDQVYIEGELHTERWRDETYLDQNYPLAGRRSTQASRSWRGTGQADRRR